MADPVEQPAKKSPLEKHIQTILQGIIAALVLWLGQTVNNAQLEITKLGVQMDQVRNEVNGVQNKMEDRYSGAQAAQDRARWEAAIAALDSRLDTLERKR
jgi:hypothetical protein